jgi:hypothetical protein
MYHIEGEIMKILYLLQGRDDFEKTIQLTDALSKEDYVVLQINDNSWRDEATFAFAKNANVRVSTTTNFASLGDLSSIRSWLYQMKEAVDNFEFDYCINLTEFTLPARPRQEILDNLALHLPNNLFTITGDSTDPKIKATIERYYTGTNAMQFAAREDYRKRHFFLSKIWRFFGLKRKLDFTVYVGDPWYCLNFDTTKIFGEKFAFASENFLLSWFPETYVVQTMWKQYAPEQPREDVCVVDQVMFKTIDPSIERVDYAQLLREYQPLYKPPYEFIAEEIIEERKTLLDQLIERMKKK